MTRGWPVPEHARGLSKLPCAQLDLFQLALTYHGLRIGHTITADSLALVTASLEDALRGHAIPTTIS